MQKKVSLSITLIYFIVPVHLIVVIWNSCRQMQIYMCSRWIIKPSQKPRFCMPLQQSTQFSVKGVQRLVGTTGLWQPAFPFYTEFLDFNSCFCYKSERKQRILKFPPKTKFSKKCYFRSIETFWFNFGFLKCSCFIIK